MTKPRVVSFRTPAHSGRCIPHGDQFIDRAAAQFIVESAAAVTRSADLFLKWTCIGLTVALFVATGALALWLKVQR